MLFQCWASVCDAGPTLKQHCIAVSCLLGGRCGGRHDDSVRVLHHLLHFPKLLSLPLAWGRFWQPNNKGWRGHGSNIVSMSGQHLRRWPSIETMFFPVPRPVGIANDLTTCWNKLTVVNSLWTGRHGVAIKLSVSLDILQGHLLNYRRRSLYHTHLVWGMYFLLLLIVSYHGERGVLCVGNGSHFCTPVLINMRNITFQVLRLSTFVFKKFSEKIVTIIICG